MSSQITTAFVQQYSSNVQLLSQQKGSLLRNAVRVESQVGKNAFYDQVGSATAQKRLSRHADTPQLDTPHARRRVSLVDYEYADLIDDQDKVRTLIDPTSPYSQATAFAMGRAIDDEIVSAAFGTAYTGETGSTSTTFPAGQQVGVGSPAAGLTVAKLVEAKQLLDENNVDPTLPRYVAVAPEQLADLLNITTVTSSDYNTVKALVQGEIDTFMGFNFIRTERLDTNSSSNRLVLAFAQSGIGLAVGQDINTRISERADKNYATQVFLSMTIGATRIEDEKVVEIECTES